MSKEEEKNKLLCPNCMVFLSIIESEYNGDILNFFLGFCFKCKKTVSIVCKDPYR